MWHSYRTMVVHVEGLISLLSEHKKNLNALDTDENLINSAMFISTYSTGVSDLFII